jgi:nuclear transport factor 2 (NTF2) superfamily protein
MDPRIEELALKCGAWHQVYGNRNFMIDEHFDIKKFAELIVKECAAEADKQTIYCRGIPWGQWLKDHFRLQD